MDVKKVTIKKLENGDELHLRNMLLLFEDVFELDDFAMPSNNYLVELLDRTNFSLFIALKGEVIVGGITVHLLPSVYGAYSEAYIYDLAVKTSCQRGGIGRKLMSFVKDYYTGKGVKEIFVQADKVDQHAIDFYNAIGGSQEDVFHFSYGLKFDD